MHRERSLRSVLSQTTKSQRSEAFSWLLYNVAGATLPIWLGGYLLLPIFGKHFSWLDYSQHGELALYSAALLAPTLRVIARDVGESEFVLRQYFLFFSWIFLTASVALYSGVITAFGLLPAGTLPSDASLNKILLFRFSWVLFILAVGTSVLVRLIDFQRIEPKEILEIQSDSEKRLENAFEKTAPSTSKSSDIGVTDAAAQETGPTAGAESSTVPTGTNEIADERNAEAEQGADDVGR